MSSNPGSVPSGTIANVLTEIDHIDSLDDVERIFSPFSAAAPAGTEGVALYAGYIGGEKSDPFVNAFLEHTNYAMMGKTPFGQVLGDPEVGDALARKLEEVFAKTGSSPAYAAAQAASYIYGDGTQTPGLTRNADSMWGRASDTLVETANPGPAAFIGSSAPDNRIAPDVEFEAMLNNHGLDPIAGLSADDLRSEVAANGGNYKALLGRLQEPFRTAIEQDGAFRDPAGNVEFSREFGERLGFDNASSLAPESVLAGRPDLTRVPLDTLPDYSASITPSAVPLVDIDPSRPSAFRSFDPADRAALTAPDPVDPVPIELAGEGSKLPVGEILGKAGTLANALLTVYDADKTASQYEALKNAGNSFAADDLVRTQAIDTVVNAAGGWAGVQTGAAVAGAAGVESGPLDAIIALGGGVVGGLLSEVGGKEISEYLTDRSLKLNDGTDGKTYQFDAGSWKTTHPFYDVDKIGATDSPAPAAQIPYLEYVRTTKLTELALLHPSTLDPTKIDAKDDAGQAQSWQREAPGQWVALTKDFKLEKASPAVSAGLEQQSALRTAIGPNSADFAAKGFVIQYYGDKWDKLGPLPDAVATQLHLKSETNIVDAATGLTWKIDGLNVTRVVAQSQVNVVPGVAAPTTAPPPPTQPPVASPAPDVGVTPTPTPTPGSSSPTPKPAPEAPPDPQVTVRPSMDELVRILHARDEAVLSNHLYGQSLIQQETVAMEAARAAGKPYLPGTTVPTPPTSGATTPGAPGAPDATVDSSALVPSTDGGVPVGPAIVQAAVDASRDAGVVLPDVTSVQPYTPRTATGTFVRVGADTFAQHLGQGSYQVVTAQDLHGQTPPLGVTVTVGPQGQIATPVPTHSYGRME